jgi:probable F420-dependent oxidoreductase
VNVRPFRFGVQASAGVDAGAWRTFARSVESAGYSTLLVADHVGGDELAPVPALAAAAEATTHLRIGTLVLNNDLRHPAMLAREAASLDIVSGGRFELGIGAGWARREYEHLGIGFDEPATRIERLDEALRIIRQAWSGEPVEVLGSHYRVEHLPGVPRPIQRPGPPILVAGGGARAMSVAARHADIVGVHLQMHRNGRGEDWSTGSLSATRERVERIRAAAGDRFEHLELQMMLMTVEITDDRKGAADRIGSSEGLDANEMLDSPYRLIGTVGEVVEALEERRASLGVSYFVVPGGWAAGFRPVVARLSGR